MNTESGISKETRLDPIASREVHAVNERNEARGDAAAFDRLQEDHHADELWQHILAEFVDNPRRAVTDAHALVGQSVQSIIDGLNAERAELEERWARGEDVTTETLRICLQQYRSFFNRLLVGAAGEAATEQPPEGTPSSLQSTTPA